MFVKYLPKIVWLLVFFLGIFLSGTSSTLASTNNTDLETRQTQYHQMTGESLLFMNNDNIFRRLFGKKTGVESERKSRSKRHKTSRPKKYSPPETNSQNPESYGGSSNGASRSSDLNMVKNTPKPPLQKSRRAQYQSLGFWEMGLSIGTTHTITEMAATKGIPMGELASAHTSQFSIGGGVYGRYFMNDWFSMNMGFNFVNLRAERELPVQMENNHVYSFNNDIFEFLTKTEFHVPGLAMSPFDIYGFVGIGVFFSDATIYDQNNRVISTQVDYNQVQPFIPFGAGFSVKVTPNMNVGFEFGWRNTIFHYLDGVKNDDTYDHYFLNCLKIGFSF